MSTASQPRQAQHTTVEPSRAADAHLDAVLEQSERATKIKRQAAEFLGLSPDKIVETLRHVWHVSSGKEQLTGAEMMQGLALVSRYELDPFAREIYVTKDGKGRVFAIVSVDGWVKILDRTPHYDGFEQEMHFTEKGELEWVETKIHSTKRSHPTTYRGYMTEYQRFGGFVSKTAPWHMLRIFSLRHAARLFTPLSAAVVTEEEFTAIVNQQGDTGKPTGDMSGDKTSRMANRLSERRQPKPIEPPPRQTTPPMQPPSQQRQMPSLPPEPEEPQTEEPDDESELPPFEQPQPVTSSDGGTSDAEIQAELEANLRKCLSVDDVRERYAQMVESAPDQQQLFNVAQKREQELNQQQQLETQYGDRMRLLRERIYSYKQQGRLKSLVEEMAKDKSYSDAEKQQATAWIRERTGQLQGTLALVD